MRFGPALALLLIPGAALADDCTAIMFQRGKSGAVVTGTAYSESMTCFTFETGVGQTANIQIVESSGEDTGFNVAELTHGTYIVDNQIDYGFQTQAGTIDVYRTFAREAPVPFKMSVVVESPRQPHPPSRHAARTAARHLTAAAATPSPRSTAASQSPPTRSRTGCSEK